MLNFYGSLSIEAPVMYRDIAGKREKEKNKRSKKTKDGKGKNPLNVFRER